MTDIPSLCSSSRHNCNLCVCSCLSTVGMFSETYVIFGNFRLKYCKIYLVSHINVIYIVEGICNPEFSGIICGCGCVIFLIFLYVKLYGFFFLLLALGG